MLRGAAKNHNSVAVISNPGQYDLLLSALKSGGFTQAQRRELAIEVFRTTATYDAAIATWLAQSENEFPDWFATIWQKRANLRYGENPHQKAALYSDDSAGIVSARQLHGKEMSFNNYTDADSALRAALDHSAPAVAIIKHANPCGIAIGTDIAAAYLAAHACDPVSAFGGVVAANRKVTLDMAKSLVDVFTEVIVAPDFDTDALELLKSKSNLRILVSELGSYAPLELRAISGGSLLQNTDLIDALGDTPNNWNQVAGPKVADSVIADLAFAWRAVRAVKSNAILLAKAGASVGVGMGQVNRVDSAKLAVARAGDRASGSVAASDAFFPFSDGLEILIAAGVTAVVSPGGSMRDEEIIAAATKANLALFFTGVRHFAHA